MTKLALLNYFCQFLFFRIARCQQRVIDSFSLDSASMTRDGMTVSGRIKAERTEQSYSLIFFIVPLTGWKNDYIYLGKERSFKITKTKYV